MAISKHISITDQATPILQAMPAEFDQRKLLPKIGLAEVNLFKRHFLKLGPNKRGWPSTRFYPDAARSTNYQVGGDGVTISVNQQGIRQRIFGGRISATTKDALTIPISPVAYGHTASEFPGAFILKTKKGTYIVQHGIGIGAGGKEVKVTKAGGNAKRRLPALLNFLFVLKKSVNQKADSNVIPTDGEIIDTAMREIHSAWARALRVKGYHA